MAAHAIHALLVLPLAVLLAACVWRPESPGAGAHGAAHGAGHPRLPQPRFRRRVRRGRDVRDVPPVALRIVRGGRGIVSALR
jgi:hypothetical protein